MLFMTMPGEKHALPALLAALVAAEAGHTALYVGTEISPAHVPTMVRDTGATALGIFVATWNEDAVANIEELRQTAGAMPVFFGGDVRDAQYAPTQNYLEFFGKLTSSPLALA